MSVGEASTAARGVHRLPAIIPIPWGARGTRVPSRFEPCGLTQMLAMRYGSIPIVHCTGGLADTVQEFDPAHNTGNGFSFPALRSLPPLRRRHARARGLSVPAGLA